MEENRIYAAIDLKSFYASVECIERNLNPLTTNLVVADRSRTEKTICLAVSPSLKTHGIGGRARLFEVVQKVKEANMRRLQDAPGRRFSGSSCFSEELEAHPELAIDYIVAPPRMAHYMKYSTRIFEVYLKHVAPEDVHVYSIDEVFIDVTSYLKAAHRTPRAFVQEIIRDILKETKITATAGIGTNLYLCKVAMDIVAKHTKPDEDGVRIAELDELSYRKLLWEHQPLTDFWRVGKGYERKLHECGLYTMGDIARCSIGEDNAYHNEELLYRLFGVNAELLIDHAWGYEPCTIEQIKAYRPESNSLGSGQVLECPYPYEKARLVVKEMTDLLVLDLVEKGLVTDQMVLTVGYDIENLTDKERRANYRGEVKIDRYGRRIPKHAHGTVNLGEWTSSTKRIVKAVTNLFDEIADDSLLVRRINLAANHVVAEGAVTEADEFRQLDLFTDYEKERKKKEEERETEAKEKQMQKALIDIKKKFGKNAVLKGMNLEEGATAREKNNKIGGHRA